MRANDDEKDIDAASILLSRGHCVSPVCRAHSDVGIHGSSRVLNLLGLFLPVFPAARGKRRGGVVGRFRHARKGASYRARVSPLARNYVHASDAHLPRGNFWSRGLLRWTLDSRRTVISAMTMVEILEEARNVSLQCRWALVTGGRTLLVLEK